MSETVPPLITAHRRRLLIMLAVDGVCLFVALAMMVARVMTGEVWTLYVLGSAVLIGFMAQIWMVVRYWQSERAAR